MGEGFDCSKPASSPLAGLLLKGRYWGAVEVTMRYLLRLRACIKPEVREGLDELGVLFAVTLFFCLIQAAYDGVVYRNRNFDSQRWWFPFYRMVQH